MNKMDNDMVPGTVIRTSPRRTKGSCNSTEDSKLSPLKSNISPRRGGLKSISPNVAPRSNSFKSPNISPKLSKSTLSIHCAYQYAVPLSLKELNEAQNARTFDKVVEVVNIDSPTKSCVSLSSKNTQENKDKFLSLSGNKTGSPKKDESNFGDYFLSFIKSQSVQESTKRHLNDTDELLGNKMCPSATDVSSERTEIGLSPKEKDEEKVFKNCFMKFIDRASSPDKTKVASQMTKKFNRKKSCPNTPCSSLEGSPVALTFQNNKTTDQHKGASPLLGKHQYIGLEPRSRNSSASSLLTLSPSSSVDNSPVKCKKRRLKSKLVSDIDSDVEVKKRGRPKKSSSEVGLVKDANKNSGDESKNDNRVISVSPAVITLNGATVNNIHVKRPKGRPRKVYTTEESDADTWNVKQKGRKRSQHHGSKVTVNKKGNGKWDKNLLNVGDGDHVHLKKKRKSTGLRKSMLQALVKDSVPDSDETRLTMNTEQSATDTATETSDTDGDCSQLKSKSGQMRKDFVFTDDDDLFSDEDRSLKRKRKSSTSSVSKLNKNYKSKFTLDQEVLTRWNDGLFYLGYVVRIVEKLGKCLVKYEDDSEYWVLNKDIVKGVKDGEDMGCCICQNDDSEPPNEIVLCDNCNMGYHQACHNPTISDEVLEPSKDWCCRHCIFANAVKKGGALKIGPDATALQRMKQTFPYNIDKLTWDAHRRTNVEQIYCYCGGPGDWYLKMLQCCRCRQWFHEACIQCLERPIMNGDRFYLFVCSHCNEGPEYIKRLNLKWVDIVHLSLYNLTVSGSNVQKYYEFDMLEDHVNSNWDNYLITDEQILKLPEGNRRAQIYSTLTSNKSRFQSGAEIRKKMSTWGLRVRVSPPGPTVILPGKGQITDEVMNSLHRTGKSWKTQCFVPQCQTPIPFHLSKKLKFTASNKAISFKAFKARQLAEENVDIKTEFEDYSDSDAFTPVVPSAPQPQANTLDAFIPVLSSYEGPNHPFKTLVERDDEIACLDRKAQILNYLYQSCESDVTSQSSLCSAISADDPTKSIPTPPPSVASSHSSGDLASFQSMAAPISPPSTKRGRKRGRKRKELDVDTDNEDPSCRRSKRARLSVSGRFSHQNIVDPRVLEHLRSEAVGFEKTKSNSYFGAATKLKKGEDYEVLGKRITPDGKVQYLVEWEGIAA